MRRWALGILAVVLLLGVAIVPFTAPQEDAPQVDDILARYAETADYADIAIVYPADGTLFPPDVAPATCWWQDRCPECDAWLVRIEFSDGTPEMDFLSRQPRWTPGAEDWETIKAGARGPGARMVVLGIRAAQPTAIRSRAAITIRTAQDTVDAPLFYREVNLPFVDAVKDPSRIRWRFGSIMSPEPPPIILQNLPVCGNCHSFSADGTIFAMDVDYANSKGSYVVTRTKQEMTLATSDIITWNDYRKEDGEQTFGLLSQISPDGRYVVSTVKDKSVFVPRPDLAFSQLFFPIKGILCIYDRQTGTFNALPGADDPSLVQSNPSWSPDGKTIVFARAKAYDLKETRGQGKILLTREECKEFTEDGKPFLFDLYRIPFNEGRGGTPEPVAGASNNGRSNFFARYSPDGRWIVFCQAKSYMLLQPDSELYIIPASGGTARRLACNTGRMNSWHSWSPNGKWLVFSSKGYSDYTQLCLTHIDENGLSTPPVLLAHLTAPDRAANIPEFVNTTPTAISRIGEQFLNDYSFVRAGNEFFRHGEADNAISEYQRALELNPDNFMAHLRLGFLFYHVKSRSEEGMRHLQRAAALLPDDPRVHYDLGMVLFHQQRFEEAAKHLSEAVRGMPEGIDEQYSPAQACYGLGQTLLLMGQSEPAAKHLTEAVRRAPNHPDAHYRLALALADLGQMEGARQHYTQAVRITPAVDTSPVLHYLLTAGYLQERQFHAALQHAERALELARAQGNEALTSRISEHVALCKRLMQAAGR